MTKEEFLRQVRNRLGLTDEAEAEAATRSVLAALADRITRDEAKDLASQLPKDFGDLVRERSGPVQKMDMDIFVSRVQGDLDLMNRGDAERIIRGVFSVVKDAVSEGEWEDVVSQMPRDLQEMFVTA